MIRKTTRQVEDVVVGVEKIIGGNGADSFTGDDNDNIFEGGAGNDDLIGDGGDDTLSGGDGMDCFSFALDSGIDTVSDFDPTHDSIHVMGANLSISVAGILINTVGKEATAVETSVGCWD